MNQQAYEAGKAAYRDGDLAGAVAQLSQAKEPGEVSGSVDHLLGNCLMKLGRYGEAAVAYGDALRDGAYGSTGALACNRGRALLAAGRPQEAIASLTMATRDTSYTTPYKAYVALGNAQLKCGNAREAGIAFRNAAIDESNPDPSQALRSLGNCFMQMGRPVDAVEAYRTALDFSVPAANQAAVYADMGMAYVAANRMNEAADAFVRATADGVYQLTGEQQVAADAANRAAAAIAAGGPSETDAMLSAAGYGAAGYDPLDPAGESGEFIPSPEDTGFFSVSEEELVEQDRANRKVRRKHRHTGLKIFLFIFFLLVVVAGFAGYAYWRGFGWPTQEAVVSDLFAASSSGSDIGSYLSGSVSSDMRSQIEAILPATSAEVTIDGMDRDMTSATVLATAQLSTGGDQSYEITLVRDGLGWKVTGASVVYPSQGDEPVSLLDGTAAEGISSETDASVDATEGSLPAEGEGTENE